MKNKGRLSYKKFWPSTLYLADTLFSLQKGRHPHITGLFWGLNLITCEIPYWGAIAVQGKFIKSVIQAKPENLIFPPTVNARGNHYGVKKMTCHMAEQILRNNPTSRPLGDFNQKGSGWVLWALLEWQAQRKSRAGVLRGRTGIKTQT